MKTLEVFKNPNLVLSKQFMQRVSGGETYQNTVQESCSGSVCDTVTTTSTDGGRTIETCLKVDSGRSC